ncbi:MAG: hypothetical protein HGA87_02115 [Desulfobulbaceae bacterium]|nr:hypothetical protein [Desulfobulbaceae bacterium]
MAPAERESEIALLENAFDFILSALECVSSGRDLKYAVLHLSAGLELILKERLKREHWSLVFEKIEKANRQSYESGEFVSVNIDTCIERLNGICQITFTAKQKEALTHLRKMRNKLEHFSTVVSADAMKSSTVTVLSIILDFISVNLVAEKFSGSEAGMFSEIKSKLLELEGFVEHRMETLKPVLESDGRRLFILSCPACYQKALVLGDGNPKCRFCYYEDAPEKVADEYLETIQGESHYIAVKEGGEYPLYDCVSCGSEALIRLADEAEGAVGWVCFACGEHWGVSDIDFCTRCGRPYENDDESSICGECFDGLVRD